MDLQENVQPAANLQPKKRKICPKKDKIDITKEYILVGKDHYQFAHLDEKIKYIFVQIYKQCCYMDCLSQVFQPKNDVDPKRKVRCQNIEDGQALPLIWKMMRVLNNKNLVHKIQQSKLRLSQHMAKLAQCQQLQKALLQKKRSLNHLVQFDLQKLAEIEEFDNKINYSLVEIYQTQQRLCSEIKNLNQQIKDYYGILQYRKPTPLMNTLMEKTISKLARNLLVRSILFIAEINQNQPITEQTCQRQAYLIFQQSYPTLRMKKRTLTKLFGSSFYLEKTEQFKNFSQLYDSRRQMFCCHRCMEILPAQKLQYCTKNITKKQTSSYAGSDYLVCKARKIDFDFFREHKTQHVLPFYSYNKDQNGQLCCNRAMCQKCWHYFRPDEPEFDCPFCTGCCDCQRCQMGVSLVKCIAEDLEYDPELKRKYHRLLQLFRGNSQSVIQILDLRKSRQAVEYNIVTHDFRPNSSQVGVKGLAIDRIGNNEYLFRRKLDMQVEEKWKQAFNISMDYQEE